MKLITLPVLMLISLIIGDALTDGATRVMACTCTSEDLRILGGKQFIFKERSTNNSFVKQNAIKHDLTGFTLSFFVKMEPGAAGDQCIFSYATPYSPYGNGLYVCLSPTIRINVGNVNVSRPLKTKVPKDRQTHHISVTWDNKAGNWQLYMNGQLAESGTGLQKGHVIPRGGTAVIGQDQDIMGGGFQMQDAFGPGVVGALNMWDKILSECDIAKQVITCNIPRGSVLGMYQF
ncbi:hypothetical protein ACROYT_G040280 [Oculina patagonica]